MSSKSGVRLISLTFAALGLAACAIGEGPAPITYLHNFEVLEDGEEPGRLLQLVWDAGALGPERSRGGFTNLRASGGGVIVFQPSVELDEICLRSPLRVFDPESEEVLGELPAGTCLGHDERTTLEIG